MIFKKKNHTTVMTSGDTALSDSYNTIGVQVIESNSKPAWLKLDLKDHKIN